MNPETKDPKSIIEKKKPSGGSFFFLLAVFVFFVALDQLSKLQGLHPGGFFKNYAFAFSLPLPPTLIYLVYALVMAVAIIYFFRNFKSLNFFSMLAWMLVFAGAFSNIGERIVLGYVRDFIYIEFFKWAGIYNLADFFIIAGIIILLLPIKANSRNNDLKNF